MIQLRGAAQLAARLWFHRRLIWNLAVRDVRSRYAGARVGLVWPLLNPAIQLVSYGAIFGYLYAPVREAGGSNFVASLFCGLWPWWALHEAVMRGMSALVDQGALLRRIAMPPEICIVATVLASYGLNMVGLLLFMAVFGSLGITPAVFGWLLVPVPMLIGAVLCTALALVLAPIQLIVRDTVHIVSAVLTIGFFVSPVLYETSALGGAFHQASLLNPMTGLIGVYRLVILGTPQPAPTATLTVLAVSTVGLWLLATRILGRVEATLDEYL